MTEPEWKMAKEWISSTNITPSKRFQLSEDLFEFAESLRDGIILCQVAKMLAVDCIRNINKVNNIDKHMFFCLTNINNFLRVCEDTFSIEKKDLFAATDLYYVANFQAVIKTLSVLSKTYNAASLHKLKSFPPKNCQFQSSRDEDIYGSLPGILENRETCEYTNDTEENIYDHVETYDKIYDSFVQCKKSVVPADFEEAVDRRTCIMNEILDTENSYLEHLRIMVEEYIKKLEPHMRPEDKGIIFMNTESIFSLHLIFNQELSSGRKSTSMQQNVKMKIESFVIYKEQFLVYASYCSSLEQAQLHASDKTKVDPGFQEALEVINNKMDRKFSLSDQLTVSFQRILKYPLLLKDLLKHTPENHADFQITQKAFTAMDDVANYINEYKRDTERVKHIKQIESSVKFVVPNYVQISKTSGHHVKDGELQVKFDTSEKKVKEKRYAFLFESMLLLCKSKGDTYEVKEVFDLTKFKMSKVSNAGRGKFSQGWALQAHSNDGGSEYINCIIYTKTKQDQTKWTSDISECIRTASLSDYIGQLDNHQFVLTTFGGIENCHVCGLLLRGQISQGYMCSVQGCGCVLHKDCLTNCPKCSTTSKSSANYLSFKSAFQKPGPKLKVGDIKQPIITRSNSRVKSVWFAGSLSREKASEMLMSCEDGAFLIRESPNNPGGLVMTIMYGRQTYHIKIGRSNNRYCLTDTRTFRTVEELIAYYQNNSLGASFPQLPTVLTQAAIKQTRKVLFHWEARNDKELCLRVGQVVTILNDDGNWWFGECEGTEGYFPKNFVG